MARAYSNRSAIYAMRGDLVPALRDMGRLDKLAPDALGLRVLRCFTLMDFGAISEADACVHPLAVSAPDHWGVTSAQANLSALRGDWMTARALIARLPDGFGDEDAALIAMRMGDHTPLLALQQKQHPRWFDAPQRGVYPPQAYAALDTGYALLRSGDRRHGAALVHAAMASVAGRPYAAFNGGRAWTQVAGSEYLGDREAALQALQHGVDAGFFQGIAALDSDPLLADLRQDPRYHRILRPARAKAAAQVDAAHSAGLL